MLSMRLNIFATVYDKSKDFAAFRALFIRMSVDVLAAYQGVANVTLDTGIRFPVGSVFERMKITEKLRLLPRPILM